MISRKVEEKRSMEKLLRQSAVDESIFKSLQVNPRLVLDFASKMTVRKADAQLTEVKDALPNIKFHQKNLEKIKTNSLREVMVSRVDSPARRPQFSLERVDMEEEEDKVMQLDQQNTMFTYRTQSSLSDSRSESDSQ